MGEAEVVFTCPINYSDFPFHVATCRLRMTSFTADNSTMKFRNDLEPWPPGQVRIFILLKLKCDFCQQVLDGDKIRGYTVNVSYLNGEVNIRTGSLNYFSINSLQDTVKKAWNHDGYYSVVGIKIDMISRYRKYLFVYFIPTTMFTLTSWVSYLLPPTSYPARTSLLVTVFLCQVGIFTAAIKDTPNYDGGLRINNSKG